MRRLYQIGLIGSFVGFCWLGMQAVHELGHCIGAWLTGGRVAGVYLHPLSISSTILSYNPHPLAVVWAGPLLGALLPVAVYLLTKIVHAPGLYLFRFFAGFCMVANGIYIGGGSFGRVLDARDMMRLGSPQWLLILFGIVATGYWPVSMEWSRTIFRVGGGKGRSQSQGDSLLACSSRADNGRIPYLWGMRLLATTEIKKHSRGEHDMKKELFDELRESIEEAGKIRKGVVEPSRVFRYRPLDLKRIRNKLHVSQSQFSMMIGVSKSTLQSWKQGRRVPDGHAKALLRVVEKRSDAVLEALQG